MISSIYHAVLSPGMDSTRGLELDCYLGTLLWSGAFSIFNPFFYGLRGYVYL
jgi:hypothetical protein